jgi:hypothetical protein
MLHLSRISTATLLAALCASALVGCASRSDKIAEHNKRVAAERDAQNLAMYWPSPCLWITPCEWGPPQC